MIYTLQQYYNNIVIIDIIMIRDGNKKLKNEKLNTIINLLNIMANLLLYIITMNTVKVCNYDDLKNICNDETKSIFFKDRLDFAKGINILPKSFTHLKFEFSFNQILEENVLPKSLTAQQREGVHLKFGYCCEKELNLNILPDSLTSLVFNRNIFSTSFCVNKKTFKLKYENLTEHKFKIYKRNIIKHELLNRYENIVLHFSSKKLNVRKLMKSEIIK